MPYYTEEQIKAARSIDLLTYLQTYEPTELIHVRGNTYCTREHDSLKISSDGRWYWWSRGFGGYSALDYLIKVKGMQFMEAMKILSDGRQLSPKNDAVIGENRHCEGKRKLLLPERSETNLEVVRYLYTWPVRIRGVHSAERYHRFRSPFTGPHLHDRCV